MSPFVHLLLLWCQMESFLRLNMMFRLMQILKIMSKRIKKKQFWKKNSWSFLSAFDAPIEFLSCLFQATGNRLHRWILWIHMDNRGDEKAEKGTKRECSLGVVWVRACVCSLGSLCAHACACVRACMRVWECYWEIFLILCVSSSHLPQEMSEESWETFQYTHHFNIYTIYYNKACSCRALLSCTSHVFESEWNNYNYIQSHIIQNGR